MRTEPKDKRLNIRATDSQDDLLRRAAAEEDQTVSDFVLGSALSHAEKVLADKRWFSLTGTDFDTFTDLLDAPMDTSRLAALLQSESPFGKELDLGQ